MTGRGLKMAWTVPKNHTVVKIEIDKDGVLTFFDENNFPVKTVSLSSADFTAIKNVIKDYLNV